MRGMLPGDAHQVYLSSRGLDVADWVTHRDACSCRRIRMIPAGSMFEVWPLPICKKLGIKIPSAGMKAHFAAVV